MTAQIHFHMEMTKIVSDVLTDYLSDQHKVNNEKNGLELMHDDIDIGPKGSEPRINFS